MFSIGFFVALLPWLAQRTLVRTGLFGLIGLALNSLAWYMLLPANTPWNWLLAFVINGALAAAAQIVLAIRPKEHGQLDLVLLGAKAALAILGGLILAFASAELFHAHRYASLANVEVKSGEQKPDIDIKQIVTVSKETARNKAKQVVGAYGAQFELGAFIIQQIKGDLYWVSPLEFSSFGAWTSTDVTPGFVAVSATNPLEPAKLHDGLRMRYMQSAYFGDYLERFVRGKHPDLVLDEASFEVDDSFKPRQVVSVGHYELGRGAIVIDGAVIVDPETGADEYYPIKDVPAWVDQVVPAGLADQYIRWWGELQGGWINSWWAKRNVKVPTHVTSGDESMAGVNGSDGRFYWFTGMTSPNANDTSMIGYIEVQAQSGKITFHEVHNLASEEHVASFVASTFKAEKYASAYPLPYPIYGGFHWVAPVIDSKENGQYMRVAIVSGDGTRIASGRDIEEALRQFKAELSRTRGSTPSEQAQLTRSTGTVERIAPVIEKGSTLFYVILAEQRDKVFMVTLDQNPYLPVTRVGDRVSVEYADTGEVLTPTVKFANSNLQK